MTVDELKNYVNTAVSLGDMLRVFIPGEWDDKVVDFFRALSASDAMLQFIADLIPSQPVFMSTGETVVVKAADGTETAAIDPATIAIIVQLALAVLKFIRERRNA